MWDDGNGTAPAQAVLERTDPANRPSNVHLALSVDHRNTGRVIATIFKTSQALNQEGLERFFRPT